MGELSGSELGKQQALVLDNMNLNVQEIENGVNSIQSKLDVLLARTAADNQSTWSGISQADLDRIAKSVADEQARRLGN